MESNIKITRSGVTCDNTKPHLFKEDFFSAQLRETITKHYPSAQVKTGGFFSLEQFDLPAGSEYTSTRVAWIDVPADTTVEQVQAAIKADSCIYNIISFNLQDVLTDNQKYAISEGLQTEEFFEEKFRVRGKDGEELPGRAIYKQNFGSVDFREDIDYRPVSERTTSANKIEATATTAVEAEVDVI